MTQQISLLILSEPRACVDSGDRPQCLSGQELYSFGKAGPLGKLSPTFVISCPGSPFSLYSIPEVSNPGSPVSFSRCDSERGPQLLLVWDIDGLCVQGSGSFIAFSCPSLLADWRGFALPQATSLP